MRERFKPARGELRWETPPAISVSVRAGYQPSELRQRSKLLVCTEITVTAGLIERLLNAPEGMVGGLTHNYLFAMQMLRLRQLWKRCSAAPGKRSRWLFSYGRWAKPHPGD